MEKSTQEFELIYVRYINHTHRALDESLMANFLFTGFQESGLASYNPATSVGNVARSVARDNLYNPDSQPIGSFHLSPISLNHHPQHHPHLTIRPTVPSSTARISKFNSPPSLASAAAATPVTLAPRTSNLYASAVDAPTYSGKMRPYLHFDLNDTVLFNSWVLKSTWDTLLTCLAFLLLAILYEAIKCYRDHLFKRLSFTVRKSLPMTISSPTNHFSHQLSSSYNSNHSQHQQHHLHHTPAGGGNINQTNLRRESAMNAQMSPASVIGGTPSPSSLGDNRKKIDSFASSTGGHKFNMRILSLPHFIQTALHLVQVVLAYSLMLGFMTFNAWICLSIICGATIGYYLFYWRKITVVHLTDCH